MASEQPTEYIVSLSVICRDPHTLTRTSEVLARAGAGLTMEGLTVSMSMGELDTSSEEVGEQQ